MRMLALLFLMAATLGSCNEKQKIPPDVLPPKQMGEVMADVTLAEAWVENYFDKKANGPRDSAIAREVDKVLAIHKVDQAKFRRSFQFYKANPPLFRDLLDSVFHQNQMYQQRIFSSKKPLVPTGGTPPPPGRAVPVK